MRTKLSFVVLLSIFFYSCLSVKPSTTKSGKKYFETFYVGAEGTQYFIKPLLFKNAISNENLLVDITFRYKNEIRDSAIINLSIQSLNIYKQIDSFRLSNKMTNIKNDKVELLFNEKTRNGFLSRFTTKIPLDNTKSLFNSDDWHFVLYHKGQSIEYKTENKTVKTINILRNKVFVLMQ
ncbi:MAG: hypothetical protein FGM46_03440 [Ferruginibacter sp.]|nr:hypothetical protein [Ferruginibacter sp.]